MAAQALTMAAAAVIMLKWNHPLCGWCNNEDLHKLLNLTGQSPNAPLKNLTEIRSVQNGS
jgi:hypothetical protein